MKDPKLEEEVQVPEPEDGGVILEISPDAMVVKATITPPLNGGAPVTEEVILAELASAKVVYGIDHEAVAALARKVAEGGWIDRKGVVLAQGRPAVPGQDGRVVYHPLLDGPGGSPKVREDGTVDFFDLSMVRNVEPGTVLATRQPPTNGEPGSDVHGRILPARAGRDVRLRAGQGSRLAPDGQSIAAAIEGHAALAGGDVTVSAVFRVPGDVDYGTGNIDFVGTVIIRGDVGAGFSVKAAQNVEVHGGVMGGSIEAGGDITVRYGIVGAGRSRVVAGGKVQCRFIEGAEVSAKGSIRAVDAILNATVSSEEKVEVTGGRGSIMGGLVRARLEVSARTVGSPRGVATEVQVGVSPAVRDELAQSLELLTAVEERIGHASQTASYLEGLRNRSSGGATSEQRQSLQFAVRKQRLSAAEREELVARVRALNAQLGEAKEGRVRAYDTAYPGVRVMIGQERYSVEDQCPNTCFFIGEDGLVTIGPM